MYQPRTYRHIIHSLGLISYAVTEYETDLFVSTTTDLEREVRTLVREFRRTLEGYISRAPYFANGLEPVDVPEEAPSIVREMATAAMTAGVGPMAAVAGAIAQGVGKVLCPLSPEVIIENGGDIYLKSQKSRLVAIFAGDSPLNGTLGLEIAPEETPIGICTSSATVGHALSFGRADAAVAVAPSATLADAAATAIGNAVGTAEEIEQGLAIAQAIPGLSGAVIIVGDKFGIWGDLRLRALPATH
ncbi:MAG: UPF0280 family protein [Dehalococcoidia bacterium]|nr:UPF0280 family protein [Dehalococcoidia bacterium]